MSKFGWFTVVEEPSRDVFSAGNSVMIIAFFSIALGIVVLIFITWNVFSLTRVSKKLDKERQRFDAIIRYLTDGIIQYDFESRIVLMNQAAERIFDLAGKEVIGKIINFEDSKNSKYEALTQIMNPDKVKESRKLSRGQEEYPEIYEIRIKDPAERDFQITTIPIAPLPGQATSFLKIVHDVSRERLISRAKSEFISIAAHQMRTPLSRIKWTLRMTLDGDFGPLTEKQKTFLNKSYQTNEQMITLIGDLLDVARLEEGRFDFEFAETDIIEAVTRIVEEYREHAENKGLVLEFDRPDQNIDKIFIDSSKIRLVLTNLLDNAIKYTPKGSIKIFTEIRKPYVHISVKDSGIGIPKKAKLHLFNRFYRAPNAVQTQTEGSGLGLFIIRNIIKRHGGDIWFESKESKGTTFTFSLPLSRSLVPEDNLGSLSISVVKKHKKRQES